MIDPDKLYPTDHAAPAIGSTPATMQWWRHIGRGPRYVKIGRKVFYRGRHLEDFISQGEREPEVA
jgi:hypothetical protein